MTRTSIEWMSLAMGIVASVVLAGGAVALSAYLVYDVLALHGKLSVALVLLSSGGAMLALAMLIRDQFGGEPDASAG